jgi:HSP20 family protein
MGLLNLRKGREPVSPATVERDPFQIMRDLLSWEPLRDVPTWRMAAPDFFPAFEVKESKESYIFKADLPGVKEADIDINLVGNRLAISGRRDAEVEEKEETFFLYERTYGAFHRNFTLPEGVDVEHVRAELKEGVLRVVVPKLPEVLPRKVLIGAEKTKA